MLLFGISLITLGSVAPGLQQKFQLDQISSGTLFSILPIGILIGSLMFGPFSDRYGYKMILLLSCLCVFAGFQGIAYSSSLNLLKVSIFFFGFGGGVINGASNAVVSDISSGNKSANLSLLGVFFAIGALGMPFVLGVLEKIFSFSEIVSTVGYLAIVAGVLFMFVQFPPPKHTQEIPFVKGIKLLKDSVLLLIGFFLFCQSSFEGIINNWTTTYLLKVLSIPNSNALYALSLYVVGMATMRIVMGSVLRNISARKILSLSFGFLLTGCLLLQFSASYFAAVSGLILIGAGLAAGFPVMLGFVGNRFAALSGTAFSLVLGMALSGNMLINILMGIISEKYGIQYMPLLTIVLSIVMILLSFRILKKLNLNTL
jgi:fucose permease